MSSPTDAGDETTAAGTASGDAHVPIDWRRRFPQSMSHEGHDVPDVGAVFEERMTRGQRAADAVARQLGSWRFLIIQSCLLATWMVLNIAELLFKPFDPYPFILLNLVLSFQAAYAAPVLLMSSNRQAEKDRLSAHTASLVGQRAEEENRAILHHLEAQDDLMIALLQSLKAIESRVVETVDQLEEHAVDHHREAFRQALRADDDSTL
jgi:uncharacterized membrane protein